MHEFSELYGSVTSAISTNQNNVRSTQCLSNKTNIYTLSNQCSITTTAYLQNSTLIQRLMFLITICRNHLFITGEINVQKISTRSKRSSRNIVTATSSLIGRQWKNCDQFRCRFWHKQIKGDDWSQNKNFFLLKKNTNFFTQRSNDLVKKVIAHACTWLHFRGLRNTEGLLNIHNIKTKL